MGLGQSKYAVLCILVPCWSMFVSTWEEFHTGTLYLGYINGPVEGVLIAVGILIVSAIKGELLLSRFVGFHDILARCSRDNHHYRSRLVGVASVRGARQPRPHPFELPSPRPHDALPLERVLHRSSSSLVG